MPIQMHGAHSHAPAISKSDSARWLSLLVRSDSNAAAYYDVRGDRDVLRAKNGQPTINLGYWADIDPRADDALWKATTALFRLVGATAELSPADGHVLDVGCGFGTGAAFCLRHFAPAQITGLNISAEQLKVCRQHVVAQGLAERIRFVHGSATAMPFADASFDKLISIEAAFHFPLRQDFFREAYRVLKPGGTLTLVDIVAPPPKSLLQQGILSILRRSVQLPAGNVYALDTYREKLETSGFAILHASSIRDQVMVPYERWCRKHGLAHVMKLSPMLLLSGAGFFLYPWDYVLIKAQRQPR